MYYEILIIYNDILIGQNFTEWKWFFKTSKLLLKSTLYIINKCIFILVYNMFSCNDARMIIIIVLLFILVIIYTTIKIWKDTQFQLF